MQRSDCFKNIVIFLILSFAAAETALCESPEPVSAKNGMVVSASEIASRVGIEILKKGGNAVDASVAVGFALAVTYPFAGNIGGGGFMVIRASDGRKTAIDYREKAPLSAHRNMYLDKDGIFDPKLSREGAASAGVPGSVAGMIFALEKYGTLPLKEVIQPAIDLAEKGFYLTPWLANSFNSYHNEFVQYESTKKIFTKLNGGSFHEDELFIQEDLASTLKRIRDYGANGFYAGTVADKLVEQVQSMNGYITREDLEKYRPVEREPIEGSYRGYEIISMPPPSSGGVILIEMLNILENFNLEKGDWGSSKFISKLAETMKFAYADRAAHLGDEDFYPVPKDKLTSKEYAQEIFARIDNKVTPSSEIKSQFHKQIYESKETTHYSVFDKFGNAVSTTTTVNSGYGSKIVVEGTGFFLNNEMDDFSAKPGEPNQFGLVGYEANSIQPEKRMLSSMTPTILLKDGKPYMILGSPGGATIITSVLQVIINCIDFGMDIQEAVNMPRVHHQWYPDEIMYENFGMTSDVKENLRRMGYRVNDNDEKILGRVQAIMVDNGKKIIYGASDPRSPGKAVGY